MKTAVPLAWKNLTHDRRRLAVAVGGIAFAVLLMFQQRGFNHALFDSTVEIVRELDCDLIMVNPARFALTNEIRFPGSWLEIASSQSGVESVEPLFMENIAARLRRDGKRARPIRVLGINLDRPVLRDSRHEILSQINQLREPNTALIDRLSKSSYGFELSADAEFPQLGELNGSRIRLVGTFQSGRDFAHEGNLLMSAENFETYFRYRGADPLSLVDLGLVKVRAGTRTQEVLQSLRATLTNNVAVMTRQQFIDKEIAFWARNTPIGVIFMIGTLMGFVVGVIICYQILANDIAEHLGEFATLKAMGYGNRFFFALVIRQAVYLGLLGFLPGLFFSWLLFEFNAGMTGLLMQLSIPRVATILLATLSMCVVSGLLALRKLLAADPASLF